MRRRVGAFLILLPLLAGCASARMSDTVSTGLFREGKYEEAADRLKKGLAKHGETGRDSLLYLLDAGLALHSAGKLEESNQLFLKADQIAEIKDYTSLATEGTTLLTTDNVKDYKGEDFEKVLINTYLAMNFALMGDTENALVEARRVNRKLQMMITDGQRKYKLNAFARYLSGILYEAEGEFNDAYIDYKGVYDLEPSFPGIGRDLWRAAWLSGMRDEMDHWVEEFNLSKDDRQKIRESAPKSGKGEIIVLYENGISPVKKPNPQFRELPRFFPRFNPVAAARIEVNGSDSGTTAKLHDIEQTAISNLEEKYAGLIARKIAGVVAKEVVSDQVAKQTKSEFLGALTRIFLYASDQADVRSWNLLPRDLQIARIAADAGTYEVKCLPTGAGPLPSRTVQVRAGKKTFVNFRYMP